MGDSQISGTWTRTDRKLHINCLELNLCPKALGSNAPGPPGYVITMENSTVVCYINKQGGTRSPTLLLLTVELLLWLQAKNIIVRAKHIPGCQNVIADHLSRSNQPISTEWTLHPEIVKHIYKAAGFSDEVSRLAAAPRRPSTDRMYDDRWLCFSRWAAGQGFDPLDPTAAQIASFFLLFLILTACHPRL